MKRRNEKRDSKKYIILGIVALILAIIIEFILVKSNTFSTFAIGNVLAIFGIIEFIGLHFVVNFKKLYDYIIDNRYIISIVLIIVSTIVGFMQNTMSIKDWFLCTNIPLCLWWNIKFFALILASYELIQIITDNRYMSIAGAIIISMSGAIQWNFEYINSIILGEIIIVLLNNLMNSKEAKNKLINSCATIILSFLYMQTTLSFAIAFSYIWFALIVWLLIKNKNQIQENKTIKWIIGTLFVSTIASVCSLKFVISKFQYDPIENSSGASYLFTYIYNIFLPFTNINKKYFYGNFISLFPIPMLVSLYYLYRNDKHVEFLLPITIITVIETIFCISGFPRIINNILGFNKVTVARCSVAVNFANLLILFYMITNIDEIFKLKTAIKLTLISVCILAFINYPIEFATRKFLYLFAAELCSLFLLFYNYGNKKYKKVLVSFIVLFTLISGIFVNPIVKDKFEITTAPVVEIVEN